MVYTYLIPLNLNYLSYYLGYPPSEPPLPPLPPPPVLVTQIFGEPAIATTTVTVQGVDSSMRRVITVVVKAKPDSDNDANSTQGDGTTTGDGGTTGNGGGSGGSGGSDGGYPK